jgi:hypothetical protein
MADLALIGAAPTVVFQDTDDSTEFRIKGYFATVDFEYGSGSPTTVGSVTTSASMQLRSPLVIEASAASQSDFVIAHATETDVRFRSTTGGKLALAADNGTWDSILEATGGAAPKLGVFGPITNDSSGGGVITFATDVASGNIADFFSGNTKVAAIKGDGLVDLSTGGLRIEDCGAFPGSPTSAEDRNIYFLDDGASSQIGVVVRNALGTGYTVMTGALS